MTTAGRTSMHAGNAEKVELEPPDITAYRAGNTGIPYVTTFDSGRPGPHAAIVALMHGNEISGALVLDHILRSDLRPMIGKLSLVFANVAAFEQFAQENPNASRYIDEDMNRLWATKADNGRSNIERARVRTLRPLFENVDLLLDLHSMQSDSPPLLLAGPSDKGRDFAHGLSSPAVIVCDSGHPNGTRLRDFGAFNAPGHPHKSVLAECGQHWRSTTVTMAIDTTYRFLLTLGMTSRAVAADHLLPDDRPAHWIEVTDKFVPRNDDAQFTETFVGMEVIADQGTIIAHDGAERIRTPYDNCVLIMPSRRLAAGQTAVRLGRRHMFEERADG